MTNNPPQIPPFSPQDLIQAINLIDEGVNQGAYKGWDAIQTAIAVRARFLLFAQHWQATEEAKRAEAENSATGESTNATDVIEPTSDATAEGKE